ncbi:MAG: hypothetical protein WDN04_19700 [Rhodospirillales bacterium]
MPEQNTLSEGQRAYEAKRAAKAGMSLEKWLAHKQKQAGEAARAEAKSAAEARKTAKKPGLLSRLIDRAHKPL